MIKKRSKLGPLNKRMTTAPLYLKSSSKTVLYLPSCATSGETGSTGRGKIMPCIIPKKPQGSIYCPITNRDERNNGQGKGAGAGWDVKAYLICTLL